ncbi:nucleopolyhedrovirus P10 family protein [Streptomyces sp.]|uniref:nucleopolyhedrovirus P10 family protein n=1 Tax=Streptomyces sp. TaxID=1931 RepID=UPI002F41C15A
MTMDRLTRTVREQVALGRLLPLGGPDDAVWITEKAVVCVMRRTCAALPGIRLGAVGVALADGVSATVPAAAPVGALPHLPVRIDAGFEAVPDEPLPLAAHRVRDALWTAAQDLLGLRVTAVDLRVTGLLDDGPPMSDAADDGPPTSDTPDDAVEAMPGSAEPGAAEVIDAAARAVPGVLGLTRRLAGLGPGLRVLDTSADEGAPGRRVLAQIAVAPGRVALDVARAVLAATTAAAEPGAPGPVTAAVVVTDA